MNICIKCARQWMKKRVTDIERIKERENGSMHAYRWK